jgi:hypothetical protein
MVKNNKSRFPKDARWGEGWDWALFKADKPDTNISSNWKGKGLSNCFGCHVPAKNTGRLPRAQAARSAEKKRCQALKPVA